MKKLKLEDITLERVKQAYKNTGLIPSKVAQPGDEIHACALQALAVDLGDSKEFWYQILDDDGSLNKALEFGWGFDGRGIGIETKAFKVGREISQALGVIEYE